MHKETINFRLDTDKKKALDAIAAGLDRDRSYVLNEAINTFLDIYRWQVDHIKEGMRQAKSGRFATDAEVKAAFSKVAQVIIRWTPLALRDFKNAYDYIMEERPSAAESIIDRIEKSLQVLSHHPQIGRPGRIAGTRELVIPGTPFVIPYWIKPKTIELLAFIHSARQWPDSL